MSTTPDDQTDRPAPPPAPHGAPGTAPPPPPYGRPGEHGQPGHAGPAGGPSAPPPPYGGPAAQGQYGEQSRHGQFGQYGQYGQGAAYPPPAGPPPGYPPPAGPPQGPPPGYGQPYGQGYGQGYGPTPYGPGAPLSPADQRLWAVLAHLGNLLVWIIAPLVVWLAFRGRGAFLEDHAKESVNFQITAALAALALSVVTVVTFGIGALLYIPLGAAWLVLLIIAAVKASQGEAYRYPLTLRLVK